MMREEAEALVAQLVEAADDEARQRLIDIHSDRIGPLFFEILGAQAPEGLVADITRRHLAISDPVAQRHLELLVRLLEADRSGNVDAILVSEKPAPDIAMVSTVLAAAEAAVANQADLILGRQLLGIAARLIDFGGFDALRPVLALHLSSLSLLSDDADGAMRLLLQALTETTGYSDALSNAALAVNMGLALLLRGRTQEAVKHLEELAPHIADARLRLAARANLGLAYRTLGRTGAALKLFSSLTAECAAAGQEDLQAKAHGNLALIYGRLGLAKEEEEELRACHELAIRPQRDDRPRDWHAVATSCYNLCLFHLRKGDFAELDRWQERYREFTRGSGLDPDGVTLTRLELERLLARRSAAEAASLAQEALSWLSGHRQDEEALALIGSAGRALLAAGYHLQADGVFSHCERLASTVGHNEFRHAALGYRAVALMAQGHLEAAAALLDEMVSIDAALRSHLEDPLHQFTYGTAHEALYDAVIGALMDAADARRLFDALQGAKAFAVGRGLGVRASLRELTRALPPDVAFLEYAHRGGRSACLIVLSTSESPELVRLDADDTWLRNAVAQVDRMAAAALVTVREADRRFDGLGAIARNLLHPVLARLSPEIKRLVIAPTSSAVRLPFHLFPVDGCNRVIDRFAVSYVPSATAWLAARSRSRSPRDALVIGHGRTGDPPAAERGFREEADVVADTLLRAGLSLRVTDPGDSRESLLRHLDANILHVAVHGGFDPADPLGGGLVLSSRGQDATLAMETLAWAETNATLVFFSGCDTGRVVPLRNQEALGLMSVLLSQCVASAALSFWPVPATGGVARTVTEGFYRAWLIDGLAPDMALQRAMLEARATGAPLHAWGGFGLFGYGGSSLQLTA